MLGPRTQPMGKRGPMETKSVKCRECGRKATAYQGMLPTRGVATVLLVGLAIYLVGMWVLVALAAGAAGDQAEADMMGKLYLVAGGITAAAIVLVAWMSRPKYGAVVVCDHCGARYSACKAPTYLKGWDYDKIAPRPAAPEDAVAGALEAGEDAAAEPAEKIVEKNL